MIGHASSTVARKARAHAALEVSPITRAVRNALAVSATVLGLAAPAVGFAGTCSYEADVNSYLCNGEFTQGIPEGGFIPPVDLTVVLGDTLPSSVNPASGAAGISAAWAGDVSVIVHAGSDIDTSGGDGINAYSADGAAMVANYGGIHTEVTAFGIEALDIDAVADVTVVNGGQAFASDAIGSYNVITADFVSSSGDISVSNLVDGSLTANAHYGDAAALSARAQGADATLTIINDGVINAGSAYGDAIGIFAGGEDISIQNSGSIHASGYTSAIGIDVSAEFGTVDNTGSIVAEAAAENGSYVSAIGVRTFAQDANVHNGEEGLVSAAAATDADGAWARARAVYAVSFSDGVAVENDGQIQAYARADSGRAEAHGIYAFGYGSATTVHNAGDIQVDARSANGGAYATGINSIGYASGSNNAEVLNIGSIGADSEGLYAYAFGVFNLTRQTYGNVSFTNEGDIHAQAAGAYATATGSLNLALRYGDATTTNTGTVQAIANGELVATATGLYNYAQVYDATVDNGGSVSATASGDLAIAVGVYNSTAMYGGTTTLNSGDVVALATADTSLARAAGVVGLSETTVDLTNNGNIDADAYSVDGAVSAVGLYALATERVTVLNYGDVYAHSESVNGDATAYGALAYGGSSGIGLLINGGELSASASAGAGSHAYAAGALAVADVATIFNDVSASATAIAGEGGTAVAIGGSAYGFNSAINNYGELSAGASAVGGTADAIGASVYGHTGASFYNAGDIGAEAAAGGGLANATGVSSIGIYSSYAINAGTILAGAAGDQVIARGLYNASVFDAITVNAGSISAVAEGGLADYGQYEALAFGAYSLALYYNSIIDNSGSISASASALTDISGTDGFLVAKALGAVALSQYGYGETAISNSGSITAIAETSQGYAGSWGAVSRGGVYGIASIANDGSISTYSKTDIGSADTVGAYAGAIAGSASVVNYGDINANARAERGIVNVTVNYATATGVQIFAPYASGEASLANHGNIEAHTSILGGIGYATAVEAYSTATSITNAADASIVATVDAELFGGAFAIGIVASGQYSVDVVNDGAITAYGHANAYTQGPNGFYGAASATGVFASANVQGDVAVVNNGDVTALAIAENSVSWAQGGAGATGMHAYAKYDASVVNTGDVTAIAEAQFGNAGAYGAVAHGKYTSHLVNAAGANIVASASSGSLAGDQEAGHAVSFGAHTIGNGMDYAVTYNAGTIVSHAVVTADGTEEPIGSTAQAFGSAIGYNSGVQKGTVNNLGDIEAFASADFGYASAYGSFVRTRFDSLIANTGDVRASASAAGGNAFAVGSYAFSLAQSVTYNCDTEGCDYSNPIITVEGGESAIENGGNILATASASGGTGYSYGAVAIGAYDTGITNSGNISALTEADDALAVGVLANSFYGNATLQNNGVIGASASGDIANANGVMAFGSDITIDNNGTIAAAAYGADATATALSMDSEGSNTLVNTGTIAALGDGVRIAVSSSADASASILNYGSLVGAIITGDLDDSFENAAGASWRAVGDSNFGAGGNLFVNHGTILMDDATIGLAGHTDDAASAALAASIQPTSHESGSVFGNSGTLVVSGTGNMVDAGTLANDGVVSFLDGAPDDMLTIVGDFSGHGVINLDISGLNQTGDQLYIDGDVIDTTTQTVNVNLTDLPSAPSVDIPLITTSGALAGDFVLGDLRFAQDGFVTMDFGLNVSDDKVSLGVDVTGLNSTGRMAAIVAPGMQSLVNAQVGTLRQRMGVIPDAGDARVAPWMRVFSDSGNVAGRHSANFTTDSSLGFHQSNRGWEVGIDTRPSEHLAFGVLIAKSESSQNLTGTGNDRFDGRTFGLYATWLGSNGFYVDASQRWIGIDARVRSATGTYTTTGSAQAFSLESGFIAWTSAGGLNIVPQAQYTHTRLGDIRALHSSQAEFADDGGVSSRGRLGVSFDKVFQGASFTWTPYGSVNVVHEFDGGYDYSINGGLQGITNTDGTSAMVELGLGARRNKLAITGGVNWMDGGAVDSVKGGQLTLRYTW